MNYWQLIVHKRTSSDHITPGLGILPVCSPHCSTPRIFALLLDLGRFVRFNPNTQNLLETLKNAQQPIEQKYLYHLKVQVNPMYIFINAHLWEALSMYQIPYLQYTSIYCKLIPSKSKCSIQISIFLGSSLFSAGSNLESGRCPAALTRGWREICVEVNAAWDAEQHVACINGHL